MIEPNKGDGKGGLKKRTAGRIGKPANTCRNCRCTRYNQCKCQKPKGWKEDTNA